MDEWIVSDPKKSRKEIFQRKPKPSDRLRDARMILNGTETKEIMKCYSISHGPSNLSTLALGPSFRV